MSHTTDIIPLASRRHAASAAGGANPATPVPARLEGSTKTGGLILLVALLALGAVGVVLMFVTNGAERSIIRLAPSERAAVFRRAYEDLRETCRLPEAANGPLRDRCRGTAEFVVLFPECDAGCVGAARALTPRSRR